MDDTNICERCLKNDDCDKAYMACKPMILEDMKKVKYSISFKQELIPSEDDEPPKKVKKSKKKKRIKFKSKSKKKREKLEKSEILNETNKE